MGVRPIRAALRPTAAVAGGCLALLAAAGAAGAAPDPDPDPPATSTSSTPPTTPTTADSSEAPRLEIHPSELEFPEIAVGSSSSAVVTLANVGGGSPVVQEVDIIGDGFNVIDDDCTDQAVAESCTVEVGFEPEWSGESFGTITFRVGATTISGDLVAAASAPPSTSPPATTESEPSIGAPLTTDPPQGTTSGTTESDAPAETDLQRCEREAKDAEVGFTPAADMVVGQLEDVVVRASVGELEITSGPVGGPPTTIVEVSLHCEVRAQLRGADFEIDPSDHQEASFLDEATIEWIWQVRPVRSGALTLHLEILPVVRADGATLPGSPRRYEATIRVDAEGRSAVQSTTDFFSALVEYPLVKGFGSLAAIGALAAGWWRWGLRRRSRPARRPRAGASRARRRRRGPSPVQ